MRLIKAQSINLRSVYSKGIRYDIDEQAIIDSVRALLLPKGPTDDRPGESGIDTPATNGQIRYNTTTNELEAYQDEEWRKFRFKEPNQNPGIVQQVLGTGDAVETVFGPLDSGDPDFPVPTAAQNVLVFIENVFQLSGSNYTLEENVGGSLTGPNEPYADGYYIKFTSPPGINLPITVLHNFDK